MEILPFEDLPNYENIPEDLSLKIKNFELEKNVSIYHDIDFDELVISKNGLRIGTISSQKVTLDDFNNELHLNFEIHPDYRGKGFGTFLYDLYIDFNKLYPDIFPFPERDYTPNASMLAFYVNKNVYTIIEKYDEHKKQFHRVDKKDLPSILENSDDDELDAMYRLSN